MAFLLDEPAAADVEAILRDPEHPAISALNLAEVVDVMARIFERSPDRTLDAIAFLEHAGLRVVPVDTEIGLAAGALHARHYDRQTSPMSMADCVALATAMQLREPLATSDPPLALAAQAEEVRIVALPDSKGRRPL